MPDMHGHGHGHRRREADRRGMRALWVSFVALMVTALAQAAVVAISGSVALLGDTLHNVTDALTAVPLAIAFLLGRRAATRRFTYGLARTEDLAGLLILLAIAASAGLAGWQAIRRLAEPTELRQVGWVAVAGLVGFVGNELVARYRITVGRRIGSAALVADGLHARTDGFTSLAVVAAAGGAAVGWRWADPVVGLVITAAIGWVLWGAAREVLGRLVDAVDPELVSQAERTLSSLAGVHAVADVRLRWIGHDLVAEADVDADASLSLVAAHRLAHDAEHHLMHDLPHLRRATIHVQPAGAAAAAHEDLAHHR